MPDLIFVPPGMQTFTDPNGQPLAGGFVHHYIPGGLTEKDTWQDQQGAALNANPIELDAEGRCIIWGTGLYRQIVTDADGNEIWDRVTGQSVEETGSSVASVVEAESTDFAVSVQYLHVAGYYESGDGGDGDYIKAI